MKYNGPVPPTHTKYFYMFHDLKKRKLTSSAPGVSYSSLNNICSMKSSAKEREIEKQITS
jgi:hypothetical protein